MTQQPWSIFSAGDGAAVTWADDLLRALRAPRTPGNEQVIYDWEVSEGGGGWWNPLNTFTDPHDASTGVTGAPGVANYPDEQAGIAGSADYIRRLAPDVIGALRARDPQAARAAIINSPWTGTSHYSGGRAFSAAPLPGRKSTLAGLPLLTVSGKTTSQLPGFSGLHIPGLGSVAGLGQAALIAVLVAGGAAAAVLGAARATRSRGSQ